MRLLRSTIWFINFFSAALILCRPVSGTVLAGPVVNPANGHSYYILSSASWTNAETEANTLGGDLATINDAAENDWVFTTIAPLAPAPGHLWIGLEDFDVPDPKTAAAFHWASGDSSLYRNWRPDNPEFLDTEFCTLVIGPGATPAELPGTWVNLICANINNAVVEVVPGAAACTPPPGGLVSWWRAEGNADDENGLNHGTLNGVNFVSGKVGQAFSFPSVSFGGSGVVTVPQAPDIDFAASEPFTIEAWLFMTDGLGGGGHLLGKRVGCSGSAGFYQLAVGGADGIDFNVWHHIALTWNGATMQQYRDALPTVGGGYTPGQNGAPLTFGTSGTCNGFAGALDEVSIYNRALSTTEIQAIYGAGSEGKCLTAPTNTPSQTPAATTSSTRTHTATPTALATSTPTATAGQPCGFSANPPAANPPCDFSSASGEERCFGGIGPQCSGVPGLISFTPNQQTCIVAGWASGGSILHDECCRRNPSGYLCTVTSLLTNRCKLQWKLAERDVYCNRIWQQSFGAYPVGSTGDNVSCNLRAPAGAKIDPGSCSLCASGRCVLNGKRPLIFKSPGCRSAICAP